MCCVSRPVTTHVSFDCIVISLIMLAVEPPSVGPVAIILRMCSAEVETSCSTRLLLLWRRRPLYQDLSQVHWLVSLIVLSLLLVVLNYNKQETKCFIQLILYHPSVIYI